MRVQCDMLAFMDRTELSSYHCCKGKNGAPHSVPRTTLGRWWDHFVRWGETPIQTSKRPFMLHGRDSLGNGIGTRILALIDADPSLYLSLICAIVILFTSTNISSSLESPEALIAAAAAAFFLCFACLFDDR